MNSFLLGHTYHRVSLIELLETIQTVTKNQADAFFWPPTSVGAAAMLSGSKGFKRYTGRHFCRPSRLLRAIVSVGATADLVSDGAVLLVIGKKRVDLSR